MRSRRDWQLSLPELYAQRDCKKYKRWDPDSDWMLLRHDEEPKLGREIKIEKENDGKQSRKRNDG